MEADRRIQPEPGAALLDLYDHALPQVYGYLLARCGTRAVAEDLTAETFLAAVVACRDDPPPPLGVGWLVGIARHKLVDHWRSDARERRLRSVQGEDTEDPWDTQLDVWVARQVLDELDGRHRTVLTLRYVDGLPVGEVARIIARTPDATHALLGRARSEFRRRYLALGEGGNR